jgi:hypothetical protein
MPPIMIRMPIRYLFGDSFSYSLVARNQMENPKITTPKINRGMNTYAGTYAGVLFTDRYSSRC